MIETNLKPTAKIAAKKASELTSEDLQLIYESAKAEGLSEGILNTLKAYIDFGGCGALRIINGLAEWLKSVEILPTDFIVDGHVVELFQSGKIRRSYVCFEGKFDGWRVSYNENGTYYQLEYYENDVKEGKSYYHDTEGLLMLETNCKSGNLHGRQMCYENGEYSHDYWYYKGVEVSKISYLFKTFIDSVKSWL